MNDIKVYYVGGEISNDARKDVFHSHEDIYLPPVKKIEGYIFKLSPVITIDGGRLYQCTNDNMHICGDCQGKGYNQCNECEGTGEIECDECEGQGSLDPKSDREELKRKELLRQQQEEFLKNQLPLEF